MPPHSDETWASNRSEWGLEKTTNFVILLIENKYLAWSLKKGELLQKSVPLLAIFWEGEL